ncbi:MAG TPA: SLBB domain-containing protein, partial [Fimbriimonas sp.]|nr:SLBB domain-containing protein [Fimbriimonas sp.]
HDIVVVRCESERQYDGRYRVQANGSITIPHLGRFVVVTRTEKTIRTLLEQRIAEANGVQDSIQVAITADSTSMVSITGAIRKELQLLAPTNMTAKQLVALADVMESGDAENLEVTDVSGRPKSAAELVKPGDRIRVALVTSRPQIYTIGAVNKVGGVRFYDGMTLKGAIEAAGGLASNADPNRLFVLRGLSIGPLSLEKDSGMKLQIGDSVRAEVKAAVQYVAATGFVRNPSNIEWTAGLTAKQVLAKAGGVLNNKYFVVVRSITKINKKPVKVRWSDLERGRAKDIVLEPGDVVDVVEK